MSRFAITLAFIVGSIECSNGSAQKFDLSKFTQERPQELSHVFLMRQLTSNYWNNDFFVYELSLSTSQVGRFKELWNDYQHRNREIDDIPLPPDIMKDGVLISGGELRSDIVSERVTQNNQQFWKTEHEILSRDQRIRFAQILIQLYLNKPYPLGMYANDELGKFANLDANELRELAKSAKEQQKEFNEELADTVETHVENILSSVSRKSRKVLESLADDPKPVSKPFGGPTPYASPLSKFSLETLKEQLGEEEFEKLQSAVATANDDFKSAVADLVEKYDNRVRDAQPQEVRAELHATLGRPLTRPLRR